MMVNPDRNKYVETTIEVLSSWIINKIVNRLTADIEVPFVLDKDMMRIDDTNVHKSVRERTCK